MTFVLHEPTEESNMLWPKHVAVKYIHVLVQYVGKKSPDDGCI
jgi:hypothetical protein